MAIFVLLLWTAAFGRERWQRNRRLRQREAQLKVVNS
jgi:hypothetical protein